MPIEKQKSHAPSRPFYDEPDYRMRNPYTARMAEEFPERIVHPTPAMARRGDWRAFTGGAPLDVEIGPGKGRFITEYARRHPERRLLGVELRYRRIWKVAKRLTEAGVTNAYLMRFDGNCLDFVFAPGEVETLFVFFPDPWMNKARQGFRRLIDVSFLAMAHEILAPGGQLVYKTDQRFYWEETLALLADTPFSIAYSTDDLHANPDHVALAEDFFEEKFRLRGLTTHYVRARKALA